MTTKTTKITVAQFDCAMHAALKKTNFKMLTVDELYQDNRCDGGVWPVAYAGQRVAIRTSTKNSMLFYLGGTVAGGKERVYVDIGDDTTVGEGEQIIDTFIATGKDYITDLKNRAQ